MGRGHVAPLRTFAFALTLAGVAAALAAAATPGLRWSPLADGAAVPSGSQAPSGHLAVSKPHIVLTIARSALGRSGPVRVHVDARARA